MEVSFRDISADAFERLVRRQVDRAFETVPDDPDAPLPWIGHFPHDRAVQKQVVVAALCCVRWAETELPPWMLPLPLRVEDCIALFNGPHQGNRRASLRGNYGLHARTMWWNTANMQPFEIFCED